jgi:hypothetical protein
MRHILSVAVLLGMVSVPLSAQLDRGTITGVVADPCGAVIPGATARCR